MLLPVMSTDTDFIFSSNIINLKIFKIKKLLWFKFEINFSIFVFRNYIFLCNFHTQKLQFSLQFFQPKWLKI